MISWNKVPVLLLAFNRPDTTQKVFDVIKKAKIQHVYIALDWPRDRDEKILTDKTKLIFEQQIDRDCDVHKLYRDKNLWCQKAVVEAINRFFDHVDYGIILEDDCVPSIDFFDFCMKIDSKYKNNKNVFCISGSNFLQKTSVEDNYIFTRHNPLLWWRATRKDRWSKYTTYLHLQQKILNEKFSIHEKWLLIKPAIVEYVFWDYWDAHWYLVCYYNKWFTIVPTKNMITNIGMHGIHSQRPWPYHNLPVFDFAIKNIGDIDISPDLRYDTEMKKFIRKMYIYNHISRLLKNIWLYTTIKKLVIYWSHKFYTR